MKNTAFFPLGLLMVTMLISNSGRAQQPPYFISQPVNQLVVKGATASVSFNAQVSGASHYQWQFDGTNITQYGGNSPILSGPTVTTNYAGFYDLVATNAYGSVTSTVVSLIIAAPPVITSQPTNLAVSSGGTATFAVSVTGTGPFSYQWLLNGNYITNNIITTMVGNSSPGFSGDGGPATNASIAIASLDNMFPAAMVVDTAGNLFFADIANNRIRKVDTNGIITTVAGNGSTGYSGDGGAATNAGFYYPGGIAMDAANDLFIADVYDNRIRCEAYNVIFSVAGNGNRGYSGDGGAAFNAAFASPAAVAVDANQNVFIADTFNRCIRRVDINGTITTVAANGGDGVATNAPLSDPSGVAVDADGNLFIADGGNNRIRKLDTNGFITTVAGNGAGGYSGDGGPANSAGLYSPSGMTCDAYGDLFIADFNNNRIRKVNPAGIITTVAGNGSATYYGDGAAAVNASLDRPSAVAVDTSGNLYIAGYDNRIRKVTIVGAVLTLPNVTATNAGNYQVIVSSIYGNVSVTSKVATLTVNPGP